MLSKLEEIRIYRAIIRAMQEEEAYNHKRSVVSANEILGIAQKRFQIMQDILSPLKEALKADIEIKDLYFAENLQKESTIIVNYMVGGETKVLVISQYDKNDIEISFDLNSNDYQKIVLKNKRIINKAFEQSLQKHFEQEIIIPSTSKNFLIDSCSTEFLVNDRLRKGIILSYKFADLKENDIMMPSVVTSSYQGIKDCMANQDNVTNFLRNIKVYEEDVPRYLKKIK